jgi:hypothetical protein
MREQLTQAKKASPGSENLRGLEDLRNQLTKTFQPDYERLKAIIEKIDKESLDEELLQQPYLCLEAGELCAEVQYIQNVAKSLLKQEELKAIAGIRTPEGKRAPGLARLKQEADRDANLRACASLFQEIEFRADLWAVLRSAMAERASALRHLTSLLNSGVFPDVGVRTFHKGKGRGSRT